MGRRIVAFLIAFYFSAAFAEEEVTLNPDLSSSPPGWTTFGTIEFGTDAEGSGVMSLHETGPTGWAIGDYEYNAAGITHWGSKKEVLEISADIAMPTTPADVPGFIWLIASGGAGRWSSIGMRAGDGSVRIQGTVNTPDRIYNGVLVSEEAEVGRYYSLRMVIGASQIEMYVDGIPYMWDYAMPPDGGPRMERPVYVGFGAWGTVEQSAPDAGRDPFPVSPLKAQIKNLQVKYVNRPEIWWWSVRSVHEAYDPDFGTIPGTECNRMPDGTNWRMQSAALVWDKRSSLVQLWSPVTGQVEMQYWDDWDRPGSEILIGNYYNCQDVSDDLTELEERWGGRFQVPGTEWENMYYSVTVDTAQQWWFVPAGSMDPLPIPEVSITGDSQPTISWNSIDRASSYSVQISALNDAGQPEAVPIFSEDTVNTDYTYTGNLLDASGSFAITVVANETNDAPYDFAPVNVSRFTKKHTPLPGLRASIIRLDLPKGTENSLAAKVSAYEKSMENNNIKAAMNMLNALRNHVLALTSKRISGEDAEDLITQITVLIDSIGGG